MDNWSTEDGEIDFALHEVTDRHNGPCSQMLQHGSSDSQT
jgi:hypothetical protein